MAKLLSLPLSPLSPHVAHKSVALPVLSELNVDIYINLNKLDLSLSLKQ
jgi:hypothetical protein